MAFLRKFLLLFSAVTFAAAFPAFGQDNSNVTDEGLVVWDSIRDTGNVDLLQAYRATYPNSREARVAGSMINILSSARPAATTGIDADAREAAAWTLARTTAQQSDLQAYIDSYPKGRYLKLAMVRLAALPALPKDINPYDGTWKLVGNAHSFRRYQYGICQNPDSLNETFVVKDGTVDKTLTSKTGNIAFLKGTVSTDGKFDLGFETGDVGYKFEGRFRKQLAPDVKRTEFELKMDNNNLARCIYSLTMTRVN